MKKIKSIFILSLFVLGSFGCSRECGLALADLITELAFQGIVTVTAGIPFNVPNSIENTINTVESCKGDIQQTAEAGSSSSRLKIDFDQNGDNTFGLNQLNNNFNVPSIPAGMVAEENYTFSFDEPGDYRLITFADDKSNVEERDEDNNASTPEELTSGRHVSENSSVERKPLIIRVLPNPNFRRSENAPYVRILSRTVEIKNK